MLGALVTPAAAAAQNDLPLIPWPRHIERDTGEFTREGRIELANVGHLGGIEGLLEDGGAEAAGAGDLADCNHLCCYSRLTTQGICNCQ